VRLADGIPRAELVSKLVVFVLNSNCSSVVGISGPLAVAVEPVSVSVAVAVSKAETLSRPVSGRDGVSRVDSHSAVEGLSAPLAVEAAVVEAGVKTGDLLVRSAVAGVGLADGVLGGVLVAVDVVTVLKSVTGTSDSLGISAPLAVAGVELSPLLVRLSRTGVRLVDGVAGDSLMSPPVVVVLKSGGEGDSVAVRSIGAPLADTVAVAAVASGSGEEAGRRPGGKAGPAVVIG
jgi:hypothetical protein